MSLHEIAYQYLKSCNVRVSKKFFNERILSHSDFPFLVAFTDTLDELALVYNAVKVIPADIPSLKFPILAVTNMTPGFEIIRSIEHFNATKERLLKIWDGIAVTIDQGQNSSNDLNEDYLKSEKDNRQIVTIASILSVLIILLTSVIRFDPFTFAFTWLSFLGVGICSLIIIYKLGKGNAITRQLCGFNNDSCSSVVNSDISRISKNIDFADLGLVYFLSLLLLSLFSMLSGTFEEVSVILVPCVLSSLVGIYSIYYQWRILKKWCRMCLITVAIISLQFVITVVHSYNNGFSTGAINSNLFIKITMAISLSATWLLIKPLLISAAAKDKSDILLLKWKRNSNIFKTMLSAQRATNCYIPDNPFVFGNPDSKVSITMVSGPSCNPCAKGHNQLDKLFKRYESELCCTVIFASGDNNSEGSNSKRTIVENLLSAASTSNGFEVLSDWYNCMDLQSWSEKHRRLTMAENSGDILEKYSTWVKENNITHTPTYFINGRRLPALYAIEDVESFINEIADGMLREIIDSSRN